MSIGIYGIKNTINGNVYIGQSVNIESKIIRHRSELKRKIHKNIYLQRSVNKYGLDCFEFFTIEVCYKHELNELETKWIKYYCFTGVYNLITDTTSRFGENNPFFGKKHSNKTKQKISESRAGKYGGANNPNYGNKMSLSSKIQMINSKSKKLNKTDVVKIKSLLVERELSDSEIADIFKVSRTVITRIANGTRWNSVTGGAVINVDRRSKKWRNL